MDIIINTIQTTLDSFDFAFCIIVNVLTYILIRIVADVFKKNTTIWQKRLILVIALSSTGVAYLVTGADVKLVLNSAILAPVFWSWVMKPLCAKLGLDYKPIIE